MAGLADIPLPEVPEGTPISDIVPMLTSAGSPFAVGDVTVGGVTYSSFLNQPPSLRELYMMALAHGDKDAIVYEGERLSYSQLIARAATLAHGLVDDMNVKPGEKVGIAMRNFPEWTVAYMAITAAGGVAVLLNAWWGTEELGYALTDSGAKLLICDDRRADNLLPHAEDKDLRLIVVRSEKSESERIIKFASFFKDELKTGFPNVVIDPDSDCHMLYTSGSTGFPKGAVHTHRATVMALFTWVVLALALKLSRRIGDDSQPSALVAVPFFHITGLIPVMLTSIIAGRKLVFMHKWDVRRACELIEEEKVTSFSGVPTMSYELSTYEGRKDFDLSSLQDIGGGGAARPADHVELLKDALDVKPGLGYGLTETNSIGAVITDEDYLQRPTSTGKPVPGLVQVKIMDPATLSEVAAGESGEIWIKTLGNARCYWNRPSESEDAFREGWFRTGDIGRMDGEGFLYIVDRLKDVIIRGGENIATLEVEAVLHAIDGVDNVFVFGVPCETMGERVAAVIQTSSDTINREALQSEARTHLASFKIPEFIWLTREDFPTIASGKVDRKGLKDRYTDLYKTAASARQH